MEERVRNLEVTVKDLQANMQEVLIMLATSTANMRHIDDRLNRIEQSQSRMEQANKQAVNRVLWAVALALVASLTNFVVGGGLANVPGG